MLEKIAKWLTRKPKLVAMMAVLMLIPAAIGYISTRINFLRRVYNGAWQHYSD